MEQPRCPDPTIGQRGVFILLEGLDRSGKSTHAKNLAKSLNDEYHIPTHYRAFPDRTTQTGQKINDFLQNKLDLTDKEIHQLFLSNRFEVQEQIRQLLLSGTSLVVDRYSFSGACFSAAKNLPGMDLKWCFEGEVGLPAPDVVLYMNVSPEVAEKRGGYGEERYERKEFQAAVRQRFDQVVDMSPSWAIYKDLALAQLKNQAPGINNHHTQTEQYHDENKPYVQNKLPLVDSCSKTGFITPWYKISSDGELDETAKAVRFAAFQVLNIRQNFTIDNIQQFPQLRDTFQQNELFNF